MVNGAMTRTSKTAGTVMGVNAPPPKPTLAGGLWVALAVTLPLGALLGLYHLARWLIG